MIFSKDLAGSFGYWTVGTQCFNAKMDAAIYATNIKQEIKFNFNDDVWSNFDRSLLGKIALKELYKQRAQQIRDSYDYVVLYYSGGSDSTTVLETFIDNDIKLDCVYVRWPFEVLNSSLHNPNKLDKTAFNFNSEWDYATKPKLEWLAKHHPEIRIETKNVEGLTDQRLMNDTAFEGVNNRYSPVNILRKGTYSNFERECIDKGKTVAQVSGIDKPSIAQHTDGTIYMNFVDDFFTTLNAPPNNLNGVEFFFWSPKFPLLAFEMAYQMYLYYDINPAERFIVPGKGYTMLPKEIKHACTEKYYMDVKRVCYPEWDLGIFQTEKPKHRFGIDKDVWFFQSSEFDDIRKAWSYYYNSRLEMIDDKFCDTDPLGKKTGLKSILSQPFFIGKWKTLL